MKRLCSAQTLMAKFPQGFGSLGVNLESMNVYPVFIFNVLKLDE